MKHFAKGSRKMRFELRFEKNITKKGFGFGFFQGALVPFLSSDRGQNSSLRKGLDSRGPRCFQNGRAQLSRKRMEGSEAVRECTKVLGAGLPDTIGPEQLERVIQLSGRLRMRVLSG